MRFKTITSIAITLAIVLLMATSCSRHKTYHEPIVVKKSGPPAHAPAHGYRRKHVHGMELVFDSGRGVYVVIGLSDHYYHDGHFYRLRGGIWEMSLKPDGHWKVASDKSLPMGLKVKAESSGNGKGKSHGKAKGKHKKGAVSIGKLF